MLALFRFVVALVCQRSIHVHGSVVIIIEPYNKSRIPAPATLQAIESSPSQTSMVAHHQALRELRDEARSSGKHIFLIRPGFRWAKVCRNQVSSSGGYELTKDWTN